MEENPRQWIQVKQTPTLVGFNVGNVFSVIKINKTKWWFKLIYVSMFNHYHLFTKRQQHTNGFWFPVYSNYIRQCYRWWYRTENKDFRVTLIVFVLKFPTDFAGTRNSRSPFKERFVWLPKIPIRGSDSFQPLGTAYVTVQPRKHTVCTRISYYT